MDTKYSRRTFLTSAGVLAAGSLFTAPLRAALGSAEKNIIVALDPSNGYSGWQPGQAIPEKIAPIKAPFAMPQLSRPTFKNVDFNIVDYGAVKSTWGAKDQILCSEAISKAIDACHKSGGGRVVVPKGDWVTGAVHLKSNVNFHLQAGATLHFSDNPQDYLPMVHVRWDGVECFNYSPLIYAANCENIGITGSGTLNGHGDKWWPWKYKKDHDREMAASQPLDKREFGLKGGVTSQRPVLLCPWKSKNVLIEGVTLIDPPHWTVQPVYCENVIIRGISINSRRGHNGDGIDVDSCKNVLIEYNDLQTNDDAVCLKSGLNQDGIEIGIPCENVVVRHFVARNVITGSGGIVIGSEMSGGVRNIYVHEALFEDCDRGIRMKSTRGRGGIVENIYFENLILTRIRDEAFNLNTAYGGGNVGPAPLFRNIELKNIQAHDVNCPISLIGLADVNLEALSVKDCTFTHCATTAVIQHAKDLNFENVTISSADKMTQSLQLNNVSNSTFTGMKLNQDVIMAECSNIQFESSIA
ncbi:MAG: glycoside hydrolase family 28 protein [Colwellia sp.]|nr:glycoside hydrolase family 28 protein [Colwellia sp.]